MSRMFILYLLSLTLRSLVLAAVVGAALVVTKKVQVRHAAWTVVLSFLLLMPIVDALLPTALVAPSVPEAVRPIQGFILYSPATSPQAVVTSEPSPAVRQTDWWQVASIFTVTITLALFIRLALVFREVARLKRTSHVVPNTLWDSVREISVRESRSITTPLTVGVWRPILILPLAWRDWDDWKLRAVLTHERTHIERRDWAIAVVGSVARCLFWFNPLVWWLERKLSSLAEQASDEACVNACGDAPRYAETLLEFASAASQQHRLVGGVAMAQYRISQRIERVLALRRPGSGVLPKPAWVVLLVLTLPALYVSAASQSGEKMPALDPVEVRQLFQPLVAPVAIAALPPAAPQAPAQETRQPQPGTAPAQVNPVAPSPGVPPGTSQPVTINPDLVGEIRLILAPVDQALTRGQVEIQTRAGTTGYTGTAVWNITNNAVSLWNNNTTWNLNNATFAFALTGIEGRKTLFEDRNGNTFSYGCPSCTFFVSQSGVGSLPASPDLGIAFQLSADGKLLSATCHARECRIGSIIGNTTTVTTQGGAGTGEGLFSGLLSAVLQNSQTTSLGIAQSSTSTCFNLLGANKADGNPFTNADCDRGWATAVLFSIAR
jgi:beta-lactamase regulating signal transducer with metallopeptidase domain